MANIYMNIDGYKPEGAATIKDPNGAVYMAINSYAWGATRNVNMEVGNLNNRDSGIGSVDAVTITRELDGSSNAMLTSVFKFDNTLGKDMTFIFVNPKKDGQGFEIFYQVKLTNARVISYKETLKNNSKPVSEMTIAYTKIAITHNTSDITGKMTKGAATIFDVPTGVLEAGKFEKK